MAATKETAMKTIAMRMTGEKLRLQRLWLAGVALGIVGASAACGGHDSAGSTDVVDDDADAIGPLIPDVVEFEVDVGGPAEDVVEPPQPGELGWPCDENLDCNSGYCIQTAEGRQCTRTCVDTCPSGWECRQLPGQDAVFVCLPRFIHLCDPCRESTECNGPGQSGNYCLSRGDAGSYCGAACSGEGDCPTGSNCEEVNVPGVGAVNQCVPADGGECACSPYAKQRQAATDCAVTNDDGSCKGRRFCLQQGLSLCDAATPFPESCNGQDDNCNDRTDEFAPDYQCNITNEFGTCKGKGTCTEGVETCVGEAAKPEMCNGLDDDCDGDTDEELCDDANPCTRDFCNSEGVCQNVVDNTLSCNDGNVCTQTDLCRDGVCQGFNPVACGDGNPCFTWTCDPAAGCLSSFNTNTCEDGNPCTVNDRCNQGVCVAGGPNACNDNNECTNDSCVPGMGCQHTERNNGTGCAIAGLNQCQRGECSNGTCRSLNIQSTPQNPHVCTRSGECSQGYCASGACQAIAGLNCTREVDYLLCTHRAPGTCSADGTCQPRSECNCPNCFICLNPCNLGCICFDFLFGL
jgi:hypothetical protein